MTTLPTLCNYGKTRSMELEYYHIAPGHKKGLIFLVCAVMHMDIEVNVSASLCSCCSFSRTTFWRKHISNVNDILPHKSIPEQLMIWFMMKLSFLSIHFLWLIGPFDLPILIKSIKKNMKTLSQHLKRYSRWTLKTVFPTLITMWAKKLMNISDTYTMLLKNPNYQIKKVPKIHYKQRIVFLSILQK